MSKVGLVLHLTTTWIDTSPGYVYESVDMDNKPVQKMQVATSYPKPTQISYKRNKFDIDSFGLLRALKHLICVWKLLYTTIWETWILNEIFLKKFGLLKHYEKNENAIFMIVGWFNFLCYNK